MSTKKVREKRKKRKGFFKGNAKKKKGTVFRIPKKND